MKKMLSIGLIFFLVLIPLFSASPDTSLFSDGYESENFDAWTGTAGSPTVVSTESYHGTYSMEVDAINEGSYKTITEQSTLYERAYANYTGTPDTYSVLFSALYLRKDTNMICYVGIRQNTAGDYRVRLVYYFPSTTTVDTAAGVISWAPNEWHSFEVKFVSDATNGEYRVYYDGTEVITVTGIDTSGVSGVNHIRGAGYSLSGTSPKLYIDDVVVSTSYIGPEEAPQYSNNSTNNTIAGLPTEFSLKWTDDIGLSKAITSLWNGSSWVNASSWCSLSGTTDWCNQTLVVNSTPQQLWWKQYANDSSNSWNTSENFSLVTTSTDATEPTFSNVGSNNTNPQNGDGILFYSQWNDETNLDKYIFSWNATGNCDTWNNDTASSFQTGNWTNKTKTIPSACAGKVVGYKFYGNDTNNNWNATDINTIIVQSIAPPPPSEEILLPDETIRINITVPLELIPVCGRTLTLNIGRYSQSKIIVC